MIDFHDHMPAGVWKDGCPGCEWQRQYIAEHFPSEEQAAAQAEYAALDALERAQVDRRWADVPEAVKEDLRAQIEWDLL